MNFEYFLAKRIISTKSYKNSISGPIIKIGIAAIALGVIVMLISIATGLGMQHEIKNKMEIIKVIILEFMQILILTQHIKVFLIVLRMKGH